MRRSDDQLSFLDRLDQSSRPTIVYLISPQNQRPHLRRLAAEIVAKKTKLRQNEVWCRAVQKVEAHATRIGADPETAAAHRTEFAVVLNEEIARLRVIEKLYGSGGAR